MKHKARNAGCGKDDRKKLFRCRLKDRPGEDRKRGGSALLNGLLEEKLDFS